MTCSHTNATSPVITMRHGLTHLCPGCFEAWLAANPTAVTPVHEGGEMNTTTAIHCDKCNAALTDEEIRLLWADTDFIQHGDHYIGIVPAEEPAYWAKAKALTA